MSQKSAHELAIALFRAKTEEDQTRILTEIYTAPFYQNSWPQAINITTIHKYFSLDQIFKQKRGAFAIRSDKVGMFENEAVFVFGANDEYAIVGYFPNHVCPKFTLFEVSLFPHAVTELPTFYMTKVLFFCLFLN